MGDIIFLDKNNSIKSVPLTIKNIKKCNSSPLWIDITYPKFDELLILQEAFNLHPVTLDDLSNKVSPIKIEEFEQYMVVVIRQMLQKHRASEINFALGKNFVISTHVKAVESYENLKQDKIHLKRLFLKGIDIFFHTLIDLEIQRFAPMLREIDEEIEAIDVKVTENPTQLDANKIFAVRKRLGRLKKVTFPMREVMMFLARRPSKFITSKSLPYFRDAYDTMVRASDNVVAYREAASSTFDVYISSLSHNMNQVMKALAMMATLALPLTVISSIWGTNFDNLPGQHAYWGFWIMNLSMAAISIGMLIYFHKKHWF